MPKKADRPTASLFDDPSEDGIDVAKPHRPPVASRQTHPSDLVYQGRHSIPERLSVADVLRDLLKGNDDADKFYRVVRQSLYILRIDELERVAATLVDLLER